MITVRTLIDTCVLEKKEIVEDISHLPLLNENYTADGDVFLYDDEALKILIPFFRIGNPYCSSLEKMRYLRECIKSPLFLKPLRIATTLDGEYCGYTSSYQKEEKDGLLKMSTSEFIDGFDELQEEFYSVGKQGIEIVDATPSNLLISKDEDGHLHPYLFDFDRYRYLNATREIDVPEEENIAQANELAFQKLCFSLFFSILRRYPFHLSSFSYQKWKEDLRNFDTIEEYMQKKKVLKI